MRYRLLLLLVLAAAPLSAQTPAGTAGARRPSALQSLLLSVPDTAHARAHSTALSSVTHVAGTPAQESTASYVLRQMASFGLDTQRVAFRVYLPAPEFVSVERLRPTPKVLSLAEPAIAGDPSSAGAQWPTVNGYSGAGDVSGPIVYANYGLPGDYRVLDSLGVSVRGAIVVARYGRSHRGIKVREAQLRGAVAVILYTDPGDDGAARGTVYPDGPYRPAGGIQRGSVKLSPGDPATPGWSALENARHVPLASMDIPKIPSVPVGAANAVELLTGLGGAAVPDSWRGGLGIDYRAGGTGAVTAHVTVRLQTGDAAYKRIYNTFGRITGSTWPNEVVIIGGHRDAWGPGTLDNISGTTSVLEAARAWGEAVRRGTRPKRTLVFATWDAEEWGLIGSSEYVESDESALRRNTVAYLNQDMITGGRGFGGSAAPTLRGVVRRAAAQVNFPGDTLSVYDIWRRQANTPAGEEPRMGNLGGGSDFAGFYNHLGIPAAEWGFGGPQGIYHSQYDDLFWMDRYGDPGYLEHQAVARIGALAMMELAQSDVVPYDHSALADEVSRLATAARDSAAKLGMTGAPFERLLAAAAQFKATGDEFARRAARGRRWNPDRLARINEESREAERRLTRPEGLVGRPWYRNLLYAADRDNGYADVPLPGIAEALRDRDAALLTREVEDLTQRVMDARGKVASAVGLMR